MATLTYTGDDGVIGHVTIDADQPIVKIGRHKECAIRTDNGTVSRRHCQIVFSGTDYKVFDLGSSNGTYYQRKRIAEHVLQSGDVFHCGNFKVEFSEEPVVADGAPVSSEGPEVARQAEESAAEESEATAPEAAGSPSEVAQQRGPMSAPCLLSRERGW